VPDRDALTRKAFANQFIDFAGETDKLSKQVYSFLDKIPPTSIQDIEISKAVEDYFVHCANMVAVIRTHITRDATGRQVTTLPQPESAGRLVKQMLQTAVASAILNGNETIDDHNIEVATYIIMGSVTAINIFILYSVWERDFTLQREGNSRWFSAQDMVFQTALGRLTVVRVLEDFAIHRVLDIRRGRKQGGRQIEYSLSDGFREIIFETGLFDNYIPPVKEILSYKKKDRKVRE
jgi:hypothetical protein